MGASRWRARPWLMVRPPRRAPGRVANGSKLSLLRKALDDEQAATASGGSRYAIMWRCHTTARSPRPTSIADHPRVRPLRGGVELVHADELDAPAKSRCGRRQIRFDRIEPPRILYPRGANCAEMPSVPIVGEIMSRWALVKIILSSIAVSTVLTLVYVLIAIYASQWRLSL